MYLLKILPPPSPDKELKPLMLKTGNKIKNQLSSIDIIFVYVYLLSKMLN